MNPTIQTYFNSRLPLIHDQIQHGDSFEEKNRKLSEWARLAKVVEEPVISKRVGLDKETTRLTLKDNEGYRNEVFSRLQELEVHQMQNRQSFAPTNRAHESELSHLTTSFQLDNQILREQQRQVTSTFQTIQQKILKEIAQLERRLAKAHQECKEENEQIDKTLTANQQLFYAQQQGITRKYAGAFQAQEQKARELENDFQLPYREYLTYANDHYMLSNAVFHQFQRPYLEQPRG